MAAGPRYPKYTLASSIEAARDIKQRAGGAIFSPAEAASYLGYKSTVNGAYLNRVAAMRMFDLVEGRGTGLKLTARAITILEPDFPATAEQARLDSFFDVELFADFYAAYGNGVPLPDEDGMRNALQNTFGVPPAATGAVLRTLLDSADEAGLFRVAGSRTKMIRPTRGNATVEAKPAVGTGTASPPQVTVTAAPRSTGPRASKIIDGVLDLLPADTWTENELTQWLAFFENALRLYYALPQPTTEQVKQAVRDRYVKPEGG